MEWSRAIDVSGVHLGSKSNQEIDDLMGVTKACPMKWRALFRILGVDVIGDIGVLKVLLEQHERIRLVSLCRHMQHVKPIVVGKQRISSRVHQDVNELLISVVCGKMQRPRAVIFLLDAH